MDGKIPESIVINSESDMLINKIYNNLRYYETLLNKIF